jgi:hypothetical protein
VQLIVKVRVSKHMLITAKQVVNENDANVSVETSRSGEILFGLYTMLKFTIISKALGMQMINFITVFTNDYTRSCHAQDEYMPYISTHSLSNIYFNIIANWNVSEFLSPRKTVFKPLPHTLNNM